MHKNEILYTNVVAPKRPGLAYGLTHVFTQYCLLYKKGGLLMKTLILLKETECVLPCPVIDTVNCKTPGVWCILVLLSDLFDWFKTTVSSYFIL